MERQLRQYHGKSPSSVDQKLTTSSAPEGVWGTAKLCGFSSPLLAPKTLPGTIKHELFFLGGRKYMSTRRCMIRTRARCTAYAMRVPTVSVRLGWKTMSRRSEFRHVDIDIH